MSPLYTMKNTRQYVDDFIQIWSHYTPVCIANQDKSLTQMSYDVIGLKSSPGRLAGEQKSILNSKYLNVTLCRIQELNSMRELQRKSFMFIFLYK